MAATAAPGNLQLPGNLEVSDSTTSVQAICAVDAGNYIWVQVHVTGQGGSSTVTFQTSNDNQNWNSTLLQPSNGQFAAAVASTVATGIWGGPLSGRYFRLNVTGIASGTTSATVEFKSVPAAMNAVGGTVQGSGTFTTQGLAPTPFDLNSAATTNATSVKATAGTLYQATLTNVSAAAKFVKLYNKASAPTVGTDVPVATYQLLTSAGASTYQFGAQGWRFNLGIALAITGGLAIADSTAVAAGDVQVHLDYV
jgi:hypothetical protein